MSITAEQAVADIRVLSSLFNNTLLTDAQICKLYNDGGSELYDYMVMRYEQYFTLVPFDFTLPSSLGPNTIKIPVATFLKDNTCELNPQTNTPQPVPRLGSWEDRLQTFYSPPYGPRYWIGGDTLYVFPPYSAAGSYRLWYTPKYIPIALIQPVPPAVPSVPATINNIPNGGGGVTTINFNGSAWTQSYVGWQLIIANSANGNNGTYLISVVVDSANVTVPAVLNSESSTGVTATILPPNTTNSIDPISDPWFLYPEVHASIAIRTARRFPADDLRTKLANLLQRVEAITSNRSEEVPQSPLREIRPYRDGYLVGWP